MVGTVRQKVLSATEKFFTFLERVEKKVSVKTKQKDYIPVVQFIGFIVCGILLIVIIGGLIFAAGYRYDARELRRVITSMDTRFIEISRYILPYVRNIENVVDTFVKWAAMYGVLFAFMLFLQITLILLMLSIVRDTHKQKENNAPPNDVKEGEV